jgi:hypothetical protein
MRTINMIYPQIVVMGRLTDASPPVGALMASVV